MVSAMTALGRMTGVLGFGREGAAEGAGGAPGVFDAVTLFLVPPSMRIVSGFWISPGYRSDPVMSRLTREGRDFLRWRAGKEICSGRSSRAKSSGAGRSPAESPGTGAPISDPIPESSLFAPYCKNLSDCSATLANLAPDRSASKPSIRCRTGFVRDSRRLPEKFSGNSTPPGPLGGGTMR